MNGKLNQYGHNVTSQNGEDGIIEYIIKHISNCPKICVEFGAWDGRHLSNTYTLWHDSGWKGILIEGDQDRCRALQETYPDYDISVINSYVTVEGENSLDALFRRRDLSPDVGVLSIDIDSYDYYVWKQLEYVNPFIIVIEHNETIPGYVEYHDPPGETFLRCSAKALETLGKNKGYKLIACTVTNSLFIRASLFDDRYFPDMPVEYLFDYTHCTIPVFSSYCGFRRNYYPIFARVPRRGYRWLNRMMYLLAFVYLRYILRDTDARYRRPSAGMIKWLKKHGLGS